MLDILFNIAYNSDMSDVKQNQKVVMRSYKYRMYPNKTQAEKLQWILDRCRELYNAALQERIEAYKYVNKSITCFDQINALTEIRDKIRPEYKEINRQILADALRRLDKAYQAFFRRAKAGEKVGFPRYQGYGRYDSFTYADTKGLQIKYNLDSKKKNGKLTLSKFGTVNICLHCPIEGKIKNCTIKREGDHWYAILTCEMKQEAVYHPSKEAVGIDLGLFHFATLSTGEIIENPRHYRKAESKLKRLQQSLSRKRKKNAKPGCKGNRRKKAIKVVSKAYRKIANQRKDFLHKGSRKLVDLYQIIVFEDLTIANLVKRPKPKQDEETGQYLPNGASRKAGLNKSINDAGWGLFIQMCEYKAECAGSRILKVNPKHTSQICSNCGSVVKKSLEERVHKCSCGLEIDRDWNAAINILRLGLEIA